MNINSITAIGRPIDRNYSTNKAISIITIIVAAGSFVFKLITGFELVPAFLWGLGAGVAVFLGWAVCREIDPDNDLSAFVAAALTGIGLYLWDLPGFLQIFWLLLLIRIINRTTGLEPKILDSLVLLALGMVLSYLGNWSFGIVTLIAFLFDALLPKKNRKQLIFAAAAAVGIVIRLFVIKGVWAPLELERVTFLVSGLLVVLSVPVIIGYRKVSSTGDQTGEQLLSIRVQMGQITAVLAGIAAVIYSGTAGLYMMLPFWASIVAALLYLPVKLVIKQGKA
mgnify:FL=1